MSDFRACVWRRTAWRILVNVSVMIIGVTLGLAGLIGVALFVEWLATVFAGTWVAAIGAIAASIVVALLIVLIALLTIGWARRHYLIACRECKTGVPEPILDAQYVDDPTIRDGPC